MLQKFQQKRNCDETEADLPKMPPKPGVMTNSKPNAVGCEPRREMAGVDKG
jgi:hypothetical protein